MVEFHLDEVAVLRNDLGGRLFVVAHVDADGWIFERHSLPDQQKWVTGIRDHQLIKCSSAERAKTLVRHLANEHLKYNSEIARQKAERDASYERLYEAYGAPND